MKSFLKKRWPWIVGVVVVAGIAGGAAVLLLGGDDGPSDRLSSDDQDTLVQVANDYLPNQAPLAKNLCWDSLHSDPGVLVGVAFTSCFEAVHNEYTAHVPAFTGTLNKFGKKIADGPCKSAMQEETQAVAGLTKLLSTEGQKAQDVASKVDITAIQQGVLARSRVETGTGREDQALVNALATCLPGEEKASVPNNVLSGCLEESIDADRRKSCLAEAVKQREVAKLPEDQAAEQKRIDLVTPFTTAVVSAKKVTPAIVADLMANIAALPPDQQQAAANQAKKALKNAYSIKVIDRGEYQGGISMISKAQQGLAGGQP